MLSTQDLARLLLVNTFFARTTGQDLYYAEQIRHAIEQALPDTGGGQQAFQSAVERLFLQFYGENPRVGLLCWDAAEEAPESIRGSALWNTASLENRLDKLVDHREAMIIVSGLRKAIASAPHKWNATRQKEYEEQVRFLERFVHHRLPHADPIHLFVL